MNKVSVTYHAPKGDSKMATLFGQTFYDGKPEEIEVDDRVLAKLKGNSHFSVGGDKPSVPPRHDEKHDTKSR
jgi:hypothetical protein